MKGIAMYIKFTLSPHTVIPSKQ